MRAITLLMVPMLALLGPASCSEPDEGNGTADVGLADAGPRDRGDELTMDSGSFVGDAAPGDGCGYQGTGARLTVAPGIELCPPRVTCTAETCPPPLGQCVDDACQYTGAFKGLQTLPEAWATHYIIGPYRVLALPLPEEERSPQPIQTASLAISPGSARSLPRAAEGGQI